MRRPVHYNKKSLADSVCSVGIKKDDIVFTHVGLGMLGYPEEGATMESACSNLLKIFIEIIGPGGTLIVPTYSYSYCKNEIYDPLRTPSDVGEFTNYFLGVPGVQRSLDPIFSIAGIGPHVEKIIANLPRDCFGRDCVYGRLKKMKAKICNIGVGFRYATFIHHVEQMCGVPYRFRKLFFGQTVYGDRLEKEAWIYNVRMLIPNGYPDLRRLEKNAYREGLVETSKVGLGAITCIRCDDMWSLCVKNVKKDPWFLASGPAIHCENKENYVTTEQENISINVIIDKLKAERRDVVSDGYDSSIEILSKALGAKIYSYATGTGCAEWIVPEKWTCHNAYLEKSNGEKVFSFNKNKFCVASYSKPFKGKISRGELLRHLWVHPESPSAMPAKFIYYDNDWGLCSDQKTKDALKNESYNVCIESELSYGYMKIAEAVARGRSGNSVIISVPICDRYEVNDSIPGIIAGIEIFKKLRSWKGLKYSYRLLFVPVDLAAIAHIGKCQSIKGVMFLSGHNADDRKLLKINSLSSKFSRCCKTVFDDHEPGGRTEDFGFDSGYFGHRKFDAAGVTKPAPMASLEMAPSDPVLVLEIIKMLESEV